MSDAREMIRQALQSLPSELVSGADRLRPPYSTPLLGAMPVSAEASRNLEVGFNKLPAVYQRALRAASAPSPLDVGVMPTGWNAAGLLVPVQRGVERAGLLADTPDTARHELVHELARRRGNPWTRMDEELLAQDIGDGRTPNPASVWGAIDQTLRTEFPEPAGTDPTEDRLLAWFRSLLDSARVKLWGPPASPPPPQRPM